MTVTATRPTKGSSTSRPPHSGAGTGVDMFGGPVVDPSENVSKLNEASAQRQDDLRIYSERLTQAQLNGMKEVNKLYQEIATLRETHAKEMRTSEAARLDSIRQVDVTAVRTEATRALEAIQTLAATSARDAETLRNALVNTASTIASQTADTVKQIVERIAALERSSYEGVGKQRLADPQMAELVAEMKSLRETRATTTGKSEGLSAAWGIILGIATMVSVAIVAASFIIART